MQSDYLKYSSTLGYRDTLGGGGTHKSPSSSMSVYYTFINRLKVNNLVSRERFIVYYGYFLNINMIIYHNL